MWMNANPESTTVIPTLHVPILWEVLSALATLDSSETEEHVHVCETYLFLYRLMRSWSIFVSFRNLASVVNMSTFSGVPKCKH